MFLLHYTCHVHFKYVSLFWTIHDMNVGSMLAYTWHVNFIADVIAVILYMACIMCGCITYMPCIYKFSVCSIIGSCCSTHISHTCWINEISAQIHTWLNGSFLHGISDMPCKGFSVLPFIYTTCVRARKKFGNFGTYMTYFISKWRISR